MRRRTKATPTSVWFTEEQRKTLVEISDKLGISVNAVIGQLVTNAQIVTVVRQEAGATIEDAEIA